MYHSRGHHNNLGHIPCFRIHILGIVRAVGERNGIVGSAAPGNCFFEVGGLLWIHLHVDTKIKNTAMLPWHNEIRSDSV